MFQIIFNDLSAAEMATLPKLLQLEILGEFRVLPDDLENLDPNASAKSPRRPHPLPLPCGDYRIYFEPHEHGLLIRRVLSKNTIRDFLFRTSLPMAEDEQLAGNHAFWELIDQADKKT